ncbi:unnamed protein product, partial [Musa acuminata subsp. burmannicoides]
LTLTSVLYEHLTSWKAVVFVNNSFLLGDLTTRAINLPTKCSTVVRGEEYFVKCVASEQSIG